MEARKQFDIAVLGSGPGGYPAAIRAAQLGKSVALIEVGELGGTCLNRGCIPSKTLIAAAQTLKQIKDAKEFGITVENVSFDYEAMVKRKDKVVQGIRKGLEGLIKANGIQVIRGYGTLVSKNEIQVKGQNNLLIQADKIIIAAGSESRNIAAFPFDHQKILDSTSLLELKKLPKKLVIIGGGIIGCEFASLYNLLGVEISVIEMLPSLLPAEDETVSAVLSKTFKQRGIAIYTDAKVEKIEVSKKGVKVSVNERAPIEADLALVAVGRTMNVKNIGLEKIGVKVNDNGLIAVDEKMQTTVPGIYAVGDLSSTYWLAHVATHQGIVAADNACGHKARMSYLAVPSVIFTDPEIGSVGLSAKEAKKRGYDVTIGNFPFQALGKAQAAGHKEGFAQVVIDKKHGQVLGAQVVGYEASALVAEMALAINNELTVECITETIHAHPTISESWLEAALLASGTPIHMPPIKKSSS